MKKQPELQEQAFLILSEDFIIKEKQEAKEEANYIENVIIDILAGSES